MGVDIFEYLIFMTNFIIINICIKYFTNFNPKKTKLRKKKLFSNYVIIRTQIFVTSLVCKLLKMSYIMNSSYNVLLYEENFVTI